MSKYTCSSMGLKGEYQEQYLVHLVIGMAGQNWLPIREPRADHPNDPIIPQPEQSSYHGGEFGYTRLVAAKETLTLSYVGNHDGEVHDMVGILASGQVASGGTENAAMKPELMKTALSHCEKGASILLLPAFMGYVIGFISLKTLIAYSNLSLLAAGIEIIGSEPSVSRPYYGSNKQG